MHCDNINKIMKSVIWLNRIWYYSLYPSLDTEGYRIDLSTPPPSISSLKVKHHLYIYFYMRGVTRVKGCNKWCLPCNRNLYWTSSRLPADLVIWANQGTGYSRLTLMWFWAKPVQLHLYLNHSNYPVRNKINTNLFQNTQPWYLHNIRYQLNKYSDHQSKCVRNCLIWYTN